MQCLICNKQSFNINHGSSPCTKEERKMMSKLGYTFSHQLSLGKKQFWKPKKVWEVWKADLCRKHFCHLCHHVHLERPVGRVPHALIMWLPTLFLVCKCSPWFLSKQILSYAVVWQVTLHWKVKTFQYHTKVWNSSIDLSYTSLWLDGIKIQTWQSTFPPHHTDKIILYLK